MNYKEEQQRARDKMKPRYLKSEEYDKHDKLFMAKSTGSNRRSRRRRYPTRLTGKNSKHVINDYKEQR